MPTKDDPNRLLFPGLSGRVMVDTWRGRVRVRKWPDKRGRPKSEAVRAQNDWFRDANRLASRAPGTQAATAIEITKNSGLYPRDILMRMMAGNLGPITLPDGTILTKAKKVIEPVAYEGVILELAAPQALLAGISKAIVWPLPLKDSAGFWSAGAPTLITIPAGILTVQLFSQAMTIAAAGHTQFSQIRHNGVLKVLSANTLSNANTSCLVTPGIPVNPGDTFDVFLSTNIASNMQANGPTHLTLVVLEAS